MAMYPIPNTKMNDLKSQLIAVSCINFESHFEGSKSMYEENSTATTIVTTNGTGWYQHLVRLYKS